MSDSALLQRYTTALKRAYAAGLGCEPEAFEGEQLTIVDRPSTNSWWTALAATFGTGTVVSLDESYREYAEAHLPSKHYLAAHPALLWHIHAEVRRRGGHAELGSPVNGWALATVPAPPAIPTDLEFRIVDAVWMEQAQARGRFENGVGLVGQQRRAERNQYAAVLFDRGDQPVAIGGAFDKFGAQEIGVDVVREQRGRGLGRIVVAAVAREIVEREGTPLYFCSATNIRSQRTALSCGFLPVMSDAFVG